MCGIGGIVCFNGPRKLVPFIQKVGQQLRHRGPDDEGYLLLAADTGIVEFAGPDTVPEVRQRIPQLTTVAETSATVAFAHRRFAILDPSSSGHQPWYNQTHDTALTFNGEIYNYLELRDELAKAGHGPFSTGTDTEVVAAAYEAWGLEAFQRFNGFWALAILDRKRGKLILSRDRFGKKPLYVVRVGDILLFASEIRALFCVVDQARAGIGVDPASLMLYLLYDRRDTLRPCMWEGIDVLPPASFDAFDLATGERERQVYWLPPAGRRTETEFPLAGALERFTATFDEAVRIRLRSDVQLCANLSGGLDSSAIVASAQMSMGQGGRLQTDHIRYDDAPELDEAEYARVVAGAVGTDHRELKVSSEEIWQKLDYLIEAFEEPVHSMAFMSQWLGWKRMSDMGVKVILHGAAADEVLAGYSYLTEIADYSSFNRGEWRQYFAARPPGNLRGHLRTLKWFGKGRVLPDVSNPLRKVFGLVDRRICNRDYAPDLHVKWFQPEFLQATKEAHERFNIDFCRVDNDLDSRMRADLEWLRIPFWVNAMDKSMMNIPIEVRMPFLDYRLIELILEMPLSYVYRDGWSKYILRLMLEKRVPKEVAWRKKKIGFSVPKSVWLQRHADWVRSTLESNRDDLSGSIKVDSMLRDPSQVPVNLLWRCLNVAKWYEVFRPYRSLPTDMSII